jgi:dienelactone hydrolase
VLCPVGHWTHGKNEETPAARSRGLAKLGYITLTYDPFGQEERAVPGNAHTEAWNLALTGRCNMSLMVWDTVRALDYMLTRPDVDGTRIACTGASGGGLNTLYFSVVDDRLGVAVPVVYITQWEDFLGTGAAHCPCSHVPGLGAFTDMGEMTALFAPKPQLYMGAADDPHFLPSGARRAEAQARVVYDLLDADANLRCEIFSGGHDYSRPMRETLYGLVEQHLRGQGDGAPVPEPPDVTPPPAIEELWCFEGGKAPASGTTVRQLAEEWAREAIGRLPRPEAIDPTQTRAALIELLHPPSPEEPPTLEHVGEIEADGLTVRKLELRVQPGITLPALLTVAAPGAPAVVIADASPDPASAEALLRQAHAAGLTALYVSPRGWGETAWDEHVTCTDNVLLGDPILGQRAYDLAAACRALRGRLDEQARVALLATGPEAGLAALFAQALWGEFDAAAVGPVPETYLDAFGPGLPLMAYVAGILGLADLPHVRALAEQRPLLSLDHPQGQEALAWLAHKSVPATSFRGDRN